MSEKQQKLVLAIIDFLNQSITDGTIKQDDKEGLEVAVQCIGEAFGVDPSNEQERERLSIKPASLNSLFDLFLKTRDRMNSSAAAPASSSSSSSSDLPPNPSASDKAEAEKLKSKGNVLMGQKDYDAAIDAYTQAIKLDETNAVFFSNRAAAYSSKGDHDNAILDAQRAIEIDSKFSKAYHRLGHAFYSLGKYSDAATAFRSGLEIDPNNAGLKSGLQNSEARIDTSPQVATRDAGTGTGTGPGGAGGLADLLGSMGGGGGGMPDIASLMQNPMLMQMAQQVMANGGLERMMQNPALANMMNRAQSGQMPSMAELMSDPAMRDLANQFGAGRGGGAA